MFGRSTQGWLATIAKRMARPALALGLAGAAAAGATGPARAAGPTSPGTSWLVMDAQSGKVIAEHDPYTRRYPASLTKLMTLDLAFDALTHGRLSLDTQLPVSAVAAEVEPVKLHLRAGQTIDVRQAMLGMTTLSANDAATALGEYLGHGSMDRFAQTATRRAHELGMEKTRFTNSSGLPDPDQVTDAYDMALLARHILLDYPQYRHLFATKGFRFEGRWIRNIDGMLKRYRGTIGMKTGYTDKARFNLVTAAVRGGHLLIGVELHARSWHASYDRMAVLLDHGFAQVTGTPHTVVAANETRAAHSHRPEGASVRSIIAHHRAGVRMAEARSGHAVTRGTVPGWMAQVGAYGRYKDARRQALHIRHMRGVGIARVGSTMVHGHRLWRAQLAGLDAAGARYTCRWMKHHHHSCFVIGPIRENLAMR